MLIDRAVDRMLLDRMGICTGEFGTGYPAGGFTKSLRLTREELQARGPRAGAIVHNDFESTRAMAGPPLRR